MVRILENFPWIENSLVTRVPSHFLIIFIGAILLAGCGASGDDFSCQGIGGTTVSGVVRYEKKFFDENGFTGQREFRPVRFAPVEVVSPRGVLATTTTDGQGRYCAVYIQTGEPTVNRVSVVATKASTQNIKVGFFYVDLDDQVRFAQYAVSVPFNERDGNSFAVNLDIRDGDLGGVFNILETLARGEEFFTSITGQHPPLLTAIWQQEIGGSFFIPEEDCRQVGLGVEGDCIFLQGDGELFFDITTGDRDDYDDDIILHEYGHFIVHNFSRDSSPGGVHFLNDHTQDIRLSWSEGWATFFSSAVRNNPKNVDVNFAGPANFSFSIESNSLLYPPDNPGLLENSAIYTTSEIAVASVLWDIFDDINESQFDNLSIGFGPIWDVLKSWQPLSTLPTWITMEAFWDSFRQVRPVLLPQVFKITDERKMKFLVDDCEVSLICNASVINKVNDNSVDQATPVEVNGHTQQHTLFPDGDIDYMSFQAEPGKSYTIDAFKLTNGADTYLEVRYIDVDGKEMPLINTSTGKPYANDNPADKVFSDSCATIRNAGTPAVCPNNETTFASKVVINSFAPPADCPTTPCTLYARVSRSPNAPPSTGRYGSYQFRVTSP